MKTPETRSFSALTLLVGVENDVAHKTCALILQFFSRKGREKIKGCPPGKKLLK